MKILLIEDDKSLSTFIKKGLRENGHIIDDFNDGGKGLEAAYLEEHDVILLDRMLPSIDGISIVKQLRKDNIFTPVLFLSALGEVDDKVKGLKAGGDDYLIKPFSFSELIARVEALNRRQNPKSQNDILKVEDLVLNKRKREVKRSENLIQLQPQEYRLLEKGRIHTPKVKVYSILVKFSYGQLAFRFGIGLAGGKQELCCSIYMR